MKIKIFLGDLVHTWEKNSVWTFPLNIGYIGAYLLKNFGDEVEVTLFKRPEIMIDAIKKTKPNIVALGYYVWNVNLNNRTMEITKNINSETLTVGGGPIFSDINANEDTARKFFDKNKSCDVFVLNQGELGFAEVVKRYLEFSDSIDALKKNRINGCLINNLTNEGNVFVASPLQPLQNLDDIPSPYLTGLLDPFFEEYFIPVIETNRSCPYRCTYCSWGIGSKKMTKYSLDRVLSEVEYISAHCKKSISILIADANFGIFERDIEIAKKLYACHKKSKFPSYVAVQWNKSNPDRIFRIASQMKGICRVSQSFQSFNIKTLEAIKRKNLPLEKIIEISEKITSEGKDFLTELILGLPCETVASHIDANRKLIDAGIGILHYNLHFLPGTEMDTEDYRARYGYRTAFRLHDNAFGIYDGVKVLEAQEVAIETSTMSENELKSFRFIHYLLQFMWQKNWFKDILIFLKENTEIHPFDFILEIAKRSKNEDGNIGQLYNRFNDDHGLESFETADSLINYWSQEEPFERLRSGTYGKLNFLYTYVVLLEYHSDFNAFLLKILEDLVSDWNPMNKDSFLKSCKEVLRFNGEMMITFNEQGGFVDKKIKRFEYDIATWRRENYTMDLQKTHKKTGYEFTFLLSEDHKTQLMKMLTQYKSKNINMTLRKMSEYCNPDLLLYRVEQN